MELTNTQKAAMSIALANFSDSLTFTAYNMPQMENRNYFTITNKDKSINYTIDFDNEQDYTAMVTDILNYVHKERVPYPCIIENDYTIMQYFINVLNSFNPHVVASNIQVGSESHQDYNIPTINLEQNLQFLCDMEYVNSINNEHKALEYALKFVHIAQTIENKDMFATQEDVEKIIAHVDKNMQKFQNVDIGEYNLYNLDTPTDYTIEQDDDFNADIARFFALASLNPHLSFETSCIPDYKRWITIQATSNDGDNYYDLVTLHDRQCARGDFREFQRRYYEQLLGVTGHAYAENLDDEELENVAIDILKKDGIINGEYMLTFLEAVDAQSVNIGRIQNIWAANTLNIASFCGGYGLVPDLSNFQEIDNDTIKDILNRNYLLAKEHPTLPIIVANKYKTNQTEEKTKFLKYMAEKHPDVKVVESADDLPDPIKDMLGLIDAISEMDEDNDAIQKAEIGGITGMMVDMEKLFGKLPPAMSSFFQDMLNDFGITSADIPELDDEGYPIVSDDSQPYPDEEGYNPDDFTDDDDFTPFN